MEDNVISYTEMVSRQITKQIEELRAAYAAFVEDHEHRREATVETPTVDK